MWVNVNDRLPPPLVDVLVAYEMSPGTHTVDQAYRKRDGRWVLTGSEPEDVIAPSHWMEVPALPEALLEEAA